jgi:hypothetical protein
MAHTVFVVTFLLALATGHPLRSTLAVILFFTSIVGWSMKGFCATFAGGLAAMALSKCMGWDLTTKRFKFRDFAGICCSMDAVLLACILRIILGGMMFYNIIGENYDLIYWIICITVSLIMLSPTFIGIHAVLMVALCVTTLSEQYACEYMYGPDAGEYLKDYITSIMLLVSSVTALALVTLYTTKVIKQTKESIAAAALSKAR